MFRIYIEKGSERDLSRELFTYKWIAAPAALNDALKKKAGSYLLAYNRKSVKNKCDQHLFRIFRKLGSERDLSRELFTYKWIAAPAARNDALKKKPAAIYFPAIAVSST